MFSLCPRPPPSNNINFVNSRSVHTTTMVAAAAAAAAMAEDTFGAMEIIRKQIPFSISNVFVCVLVDGLWLYPPESSIVARILRRRYTLRYIEDQIDGWIYAMALCHTCQRGISANAQRPSHLFFSLHSEQPRRRHTADSASDWRPPHCTNCYWHRPTRWNSYLS